MKSYRLITLTLVASIILSGCASTALCESAYDVVDGSFENYVDRQKRESRDISRPIDDKFNDQDLAAGVITAGIRGFFRLFESNSKKKTNPNSLSSQCPRT